MESQPQNPEFRNNPEIFHPRNMLFFQGVLVMSGGTPSTTGKFKVPVMLPLRYFNRK